MRRAPADRRFFPPLQLTEVKVLACKRPQATGQPLSRFSVEDLRLRAWEQDLRLSYSTLWRLLHQDALRPWFQRQWLFPQDPRLLEKATPVLELYGGRWQGRPLGPHDLLLCGDEMTNLQPLSRHHATEPPGPGQAGRYEFSHDQPHERLVYLALREVRTGSVFGTVAPRNGIAPFEHLVQRYLASERAAAAERIFLIVDNGGAHHPSTAPARLAALDERLTLVSLPAHSSWLNQIELYFSLVKRKALTPWDFPDGEALAARIIAFESYYNRGARPFRWKYTVADLRQYLKRLEGLGQWPPLPSLRDRSHEKQRKLSPPHPAIGATNSDRNPSRFNESG